MKKIFLTLAVAIATYYSYAQSNVLNSTGNVLIGSTTDNGSGAVLQVTGNTTGVISTFSNHVKALSARFGDNGQAPDKTLDVIGTMALGDATNAPLTIQTGNSTTAIARLIINQNLSGGANILMQGQANNGGNGVAPIIYFADGNKAYASMGGSILSAGSGTTGFLTFSTTPNNATTALTERMRISESGRIGIGITNPTTLLDVNGTGNFAGQLNVSSEAIGTYASSSSVPGNSLVVSGSIGIGTDNPSGRLEVATGPIIASGFNNRPSGTGPALEIGYDGNQTVLQSYDRTTSLNVPAFFSASRYNFTVGNVGIDTETPDAKLAVNGIIHSKEVKVDLTGWPDYVFKPKYILPTLTEVQTYIYQNQHLPDMPSEAEVTKNGLNLGEIVKIQTKKIEELTLYLMEENDKNSKQEARIETLEAALSKLTAVSYIK